MLKLRNLQRVGLAAMMLLVLLALAACGGGGGGGGGGNDGGGNDGGAQVEDGRVEVVMNEYSFEPKDIEVAVGDSVTFVLNNEGALAHDMAFDDLDVTSDEVVSGDSTEFVVQFDEAGTYDFYCTVPGHKESGMVGTVTAK